MDLSITSAEGVMITCDVPTKQLILHLNAGQNFVLKDLDATHLLVDAGSVEKIKQMVYSHLESNVWVIETSK